MHLTSDIYAFVDRTASHGTEKKCVKQIVAPFLVFTKLCHVRSTGTVNVFALFYHQDNMSVKCIPPYTPLLYSKTGECRGIPIFLIFASKHRLWEYIVGTR